MSGTHHADSGSCLGAIPISMDLLQLHTGAQNHPAAMVADE